jgi:hypothetical protein
MPLQLRIYTIKPGAMDIFIRDWKEKIQPLRLEIGCTIPAAWMSREADRFFWLMSYEGADRWEDMERRYHKSPQRRSMDPDPARNIAHIEHFFLDPVD